MKISVAVLSALPFAVGYTLPDGTGRLPALGWNSWVRPYGYEYRLLQLTIQLECVRMRYQCGQDHDCCECND